MMIMIYTNFIIRIIKGYTVLICFKMWTATKAKKTLVIHNGLAINNICVT